MAQNAATTAAAVLLFLALATSPAAAFNITRILGEFPDFSSFNDLLTRTKLADDINSRQTITVLALDNGAAGGISSLSSDVQRDVLSVHVVLDYYDKEKLGAMKNRSAGLTTLFQSSGHATDRMGFLSYTKRQDGVMMFGSAEPGAQLTSQIVKSVFFRPYNISVLQVSSAIVPPGIGSTNAKPPLPAKAPAPVPSNSPKIAPSPKSHAPAPSNDSSPADAPGPAPAHSPAAKAPTADSPAADAPAKADEPASHKNSDSADEPTAGGGAVVGAALRTVAVAVLMTIVSL